MAHVVLKRLNVIGQGTKHISMPQSATTRSSLASYTDGLGRCTYFQGRCMNRCRGTCDLEGVTCAGVAKLTSREQLYMTGSCFVGILHMGQVIQLLWQFVLHHLGRGWTPISNKQQATSNSNSTIQQVTSNRLAQGGPKVHIPSTNVRTGMSARVPKAWLHGFMLANPSHSCMHVQGHSVHAHGHMQICRGGGECFMQLCQG